MPRYIDADALIDDIRKHSESYFADDFAHEWVDKQPSADVQPVRRGHWVYGEDDYGIDGYRCNKCGFFVPWDYTHKSINFIEDYHYCPHCNARMDGEQNG